MEQITVNLKERSYPIYIGRNNLDLVGELMGKKGFKGKVACITNPTVGRLYGHRIISSLNKAGFETFRIDIPDGEEYKSLEWLSHIYDKLIEYKMERLSSIVALGGGVIGDIAGFAAATYLRGVPYIQVPTTLLAQVDSSVGGKTAVNHTMGKNLIGAFYQPKMVFIDVDVLKTLGDRDVKAGLAEVVKYGIIRDSKFFSFLEYNYRDVLGFGDGLIYSVKMSCAIKASIVEQDETEADLRAILNFGHTFGHAIETVTNYKELRHGEAVAIGMAAAARLSLKLGVCSKGVVEKIEGLISKIGFHVKLSAISCQLTASGLLKAMEIDKKVAGGKINFVMVEDIGKTAFRQIGSADFPLDLLEILN
ncbi:MAG: 3-dehydroquinate synthase [Deltaproteobacteria bacterium]|nr:3-dehydroquinate synthase [Deltaproteobacteria bacterium]